MTGKKYTIVCLTSILIILVIFAVVTYIIDPFFHYHKPYEWVSYTLNDERYQNDGILKHFDYNAIITGTSMTQNFRTSELDKLFNVSSVKTSFSGASYKEIHDSLKTALTHNSNIKYIIRCLDTDKIIHKFDDMKYDEYPTYLYDNLLYNDVNYVFNKTVLFKKTIPTFIDSINNEKSTSFDDYSSWYKKRKFGKEEVINSHTRVKKREEKKFTESIKEDVYKTITYNVIDLAREYPDTQFFVFFPPYSIYYWDSQLYYGGIRAHLEAIEYAISLMLEYDNIHIYSFMNEYDIITNLDNYKDSIHYSEKINSQMLIWMKEEHDLITKDNYKDYMQKVIKYYTEFNYDSLEVK